MTDAIVASDIKEFILAHIDSIAQLEALLLLRANPNELWDAGRTARRLYLSERETQDVLTRLCVEGLLSSAGASYCYAGIAAERAAMIDRLAEAYSRHLIPVTNIIHQKPRRIREFAAAFKFKKEPYVAPIIYLLCALTAALCAHLLLQAYRRGRYRLLLWSGLCFVGLTINNALLVLDKIAFPAIDLSVPRTLVALLAMITLLYGLIWDAD